MRVSTTSNETQVREILAKKVSGIFVGLWLLIAEHLRIGSWDVLKSWAGGYDHDIPARVALQIVHESALCVNGIRPRHTLCHQGFEVLNGLSHIVSDEEIHQLLNQHTISEAIQLQENLGKLRWANGHYSGKLLAVDPHRIVTYSKRVMPKKKKLPKEPSKKVLQTFFCIDAQTGQPYGHMVGTSGVTATKATIDLLKMVEQINPRPSVILADTEHFTDDLLSYVNKHPMYDILVPAPYTSKVQKLIRSLTYKKMWAGYAIASTDYSFNSNPDKFMLVVERTGEITSQYQYKAFISTAREKVLQLLTEDYCQRWNIEEFFNFEGDLGWNRVSTMNLNVRYGKMSLALVAQSAIYQLRQKLPPPYKQWSAATMADNIFRGIDGDIRVHDDTIVATLYNVPEHLNLTKHYSNLPSKLIAQGRDPRIPWLYGFKLDFSFK